VTRAARGIGRASAVALAREGADIMGIDIAGCGFRRLRTGVPIDCGHRFRSIADSVPVIPDSGPADGFQGFTPWRRCQAWARFPDLSGEARMVSGATYDATGGDSANYTA
jgi:hypothetical protein